MHSDIPSSAYSSKLRRIKITNWRPIKITTECLKNVTQDGNLQMSKVRH